MLWQNLPLFVKYRVRQREGFRLPGSIKDIHGMRMYMPREFKPGDPPRAISRFDLARTDEAIVWEHYPERSAHVLMLVDVSASEKIGTERSKHEAMLEVINGICVACMNRRFPVSLAAFTTKIEWESRLVTSSTGLRNAVYELSNFVPQNIGTDIRDAIDFASKRVTREWYPVDLVCIFSDFLYENQRKNDFSYLTGETDVVCIAMRDTIETGFPQVFGGVKILDAESGEMSFVSGLSDSEPTKYLEDLGIDVCVLNTADSEEDYFVELSEFFTIRGRETKGGRKP